MANDNNNNNNNNNNNRYDSILNPKIFEKLGIDRKKEEKKINDNIKKDK